MKELTLQNKKVLSVLYADAVDLLQKLVATPSLSRQEDKTAGLLHDFFVDRNLEPERAGNNIIVKNRYFDPAKPTLLLNSHHDTVKPNGGYTRDPFSADIIGGKLYGLGSNDAGGCLVSLVAAFLHFSEEEQLNYNLLLVASAEEEISGTNGIELVLQRHPYIDCAIVGEPTLLEMAVAERGLLVLDCVSTGTAGHAARDEGDNAIYKAMKDIRALSDYRFEKVSSLLGPVKISVTSIHTDNKAHNVVPDVCRFVVDVRINELYTHEQVLSRLREVASCDMQPRSMRLRSSVIDVHHALVEAGASLGLGQYGSPTTSDKALMHFPALKLGPGDSARSHSADEFIYLAEIRRGIAIYIDLIKKLVQ
jgi:acetylornithine deacetylase